MEMDHIKDMKLKGSGKFFHNLFMFITYPLRHFFKFLIFLFIICVLLMAVPMSQGVSYRNVIDWYLCRYDETTENIPTVGNIAEKFEKVAKTVTATKDEDERFAEVQAPKIVRKSKNKITGSVSARERVFKRPPVKLPEEVNTQKQPVQLDDGLLELKTEAVVDLEIPSSDIKSYYRKDEALPLIFEDEPQTISGKTIVFNANEFAVDNTYIILYGIYTGSDKFDTQKAFEYTRELVEGKVIECKIVAYTHDNIATGICFLDGRSINQNLVDAGFAENIAL